MGREAVLTEVGSQTFKLQVKLTGFYRSSVVTVCIDTGTLAFPSKPPAVHVWVPIEHEWLPYAEWLGCANDSVVHVNKWCPPWWRNERWVKSLTRELQHNAEKKRCSSDRFVCQRLFYEYPKDIIDHICEFI